MLSAEEIEEIKKYNEKIAKLRHKLFRLFEILTGIAFMAAALYPHFPVCLALLICACVFAILSNQFCDD